MLGDLQSKTGVGRNSIVAQHWPYVPTHWCKLLSIVKLNRFRLCCFSENEWHLRVDMISIWQRSFTVPCKCWRHKKTNGVWKFVYFPQPAEKSKLFAVIYTAAISKARFEESMPLLASITNQNFQLERLRVKEGPLMAAVIVQPKSFKKQEKYACGSTTQWNDAQSRTRLHA